MPIVPSDETPSNRLPPELCSACKKQWALGGYSHALIRALDPAGLNRALCPPCLKRAQADLANASADAGYARGATDMGRILDETPHNPNVYILQCDACHNYAKLCKAAAGVKSGNVRLSLALVAKPTGKSAKTLERWLDAHYLGTGHERLQPTEMLERYTTLDVE